MSLYPPLVAAPDEKHPAHPLPLGIVQSLLQQAGWKSHVLQPETADATLLRFVAEKGQLEQEVARLNQENLALRMDLQAARAQNERDVAEALGAMAEEIVKPMREVLREVEWGRLYGVAGRACPSCGGTKTLELMNHPEPAGHRKGCRLAVFLKVT